MDSKKNSSETSIKVKITNMEYNKSNNLFKMHVEEVDGDRKTCLAIRGTDFQITPDVPIDIINNFCEQMKGKEKNLYIEFDSSIKENKNSSEKIKELNEEIDQYPIKEIVDEEINKYNASGK